MDFPLRAWKETLANLGLLRRETRPKAKRRSSRFRQFESLEDRRLMATTLYWDPTASLGTNLGGTGTWDTSSAVWYSPTTNTDVAWNNANGEKAVFAGTANTVTVSSGISAGEVDFTSSAYILQGGSLEISGTATVDVAAGLADTIESTLSGSNGLSITDTGTLLVSGANTFTGDTSISAGTLQLGNDSALSSSSVSISSGATLDLNGTNPTIAGLSGSGTITNTASPALELDFLSEESVPSSTLTVGLNGTSSEFDGSLQDGTGGINLTKIGAGTLTLSGSNTYSGATTISAGELVASSADSLSANSAFEVAATLDLGGNNQSIGSLWGTGTVQSTGSANVTLTTGNDGSASLFSGIIQDGPSSGSLSLEVSGTGSTALSGANTYSGGTTVDAGATFQLGDGVSSNGSIVGNIADSGTVQFANATNQTFGASITGDGGLTVSGPGTLVLTNSSSFTGETTVSAGATLQAGGTNVLSGASLVDVGGTLNLNGYDQTIDGLSGESGAQVTLGTATLTIDGSDNGSTTFGGVISGAGNFDKLGTDTLVLTAANTYTGQTIIDDGAIVLGDNNHSVLNAPSDGTGPVNAVDLTNDFNAIGVTADGAGTTSGGLDGSGDTLSGTLLGASQTWNSNTFSFGPAGDYSAITASGQDIDLASVPLSQIQILATAVGGNQTAQTFTVNYTDGSSTTFTQDMSGWTSSQGYTGESVALTMAYSNLANGSASGEPVNVYGYTFTVDPTKSVASITLPDNPDVVLLAVDSVAPTDTVTNLVAAPASSGTMHLSWTAPSGTIAGYNVFRGQSSGGELTLLNSSPLAATTTTFDDTTVVPGNQYHYVVQAISPTESGPSVETDLTSAYNLTGITSDGTTFSGGLDGGGEALSSTLLGSSQTWNGLPFTLGAADQADVVKSAGQTVALSPGFYGSLDLLMTATNGNQPAQTFTVNYTDGTSTTFTQGVSDWYSPQGYSGESVAVTMAYRNNANGTEDGRTFHVYGYTFNLDSSKAVASITLPNNGNVFLLGATAETIGTISNETSATTPTSGSSVQADLSSAFNHAGITADGVAFTGGGLDGGGNALSAAALGTSQTWNGANFIIGPAGRNDAVQAAGQTVALPSGQYSQLDLLMTATNGNQAAQTFTVNYSDGSSTTFTQGVSDWFTPQGYSGESVAIATPYRNMSNGTTDNRTFNVYGYTFNLDSSKTVVSIAMPTNSNLFLFAATEHVQNTLPTGGSVQINGDGLLSLNGTDQTIGSLSGSGGTVSLDGATLTTGGDNTSTTYAGTITGSGNLTKIGTGTFTLSASSDYVGTTTVAEGTLQAGADNVFDPNSDYRLDSILDLAGLSESLGSLAGNGVVTNSGSSLATLTVGGDNASTTFSGSLQDGASAQLGLSKIGSGTLALEGLNTMTGSTQINGGTLEINNNILHSNVTVNVGGILQGSGGTAQTILNGGTATQQLYVVSFNSQLQQGSTADTDTGSITFDPLLDLGAVLAQSEADAAFKALEGSASVAQTGETYDLHSDAFIYRPTYQLTLNGTTSIINQAIWLEDLTNQPGDDKDYNDAYFQLSIHQNTTNPKAVDDSYNDGVGGPLTTDASDGLLANDISQSGSQLTVASVNGSTSSTIATAHGTLTWSADGSFNYTPTLGFSGLDMFTYVDSYVGTGGTIKSNTATAIIQDHSVKIDLLDDANGDGSINTLDEAVKNNGTGAVILASNGPETPGANADAAHLAQLQVTVGLSNSSTALPTNLSGWTLTLSASDPSTIKIWDSLNKNEEVDNAGVVTLTSQLTTLPSLNNQLYVEMTSVGTETLTLTLADATGNVKAQDTVNVTAIAGRIYAPQIAHNVVDGASMPRLAQVTQGAYIPLNNEDDNYALTAANKSIPDYEQTGAIEGDQFLMPIFLTGSSASGDYYQLNIPTNVRVWADQQRTEQITSFQSLTLNSNGKLQVWVEGVTVGSSTLTLIADLNGKEAVIADSLKITVFAFHGEQTAPGASQYTYSVTGADGSFDTTNSVHAGFENVTPTTATVVWDNEPVVGGIAYRASQYFDWTYSVTVVQVSLSSYSITTPGVVGLQSLNGRPGINSASDGTPAMEARVYLTLQGPTVEGISRGVNFINAGFVQNVTTRVTNVTYGSGMNAVPFTNTAQGSNTLLDRITQNSPLTPWYDSTPRSNGLFLGTPDALYFSNYLSVTDAPFITLPPSMIPNTNLTLSKLNLDWQFNMFFVATSTDTNSTGAAPVFTQYGFGSWAFDGSGAITVANGVPTWTPNTDPTKGLVAGDRVIEPFLATFIPAHAGLVTSEPTFNRRDLNSRVNKWN